MILHNCCSSTISSLAFLSVCLSVGLSLHLSPPLSQKLVIVICYTHLIYKRRVLCHYTYMTFLRIHSVLNITKIKCKLQCISEKLCIIRNVYLPDTVHPFSTFTGSFVSQYTERLKCVFSFEKV